MIYENTLLGRIFTSISWRYFRTNLRHSVSVTLLLNLFFLTIAITASAWPLLFLSFVISLPFFALIIYYINRLRFLKRNVESFIYETVVFPKAKGCCRNYSFEIDALDTYGRKRKSTRAIFNNHPSHYLAITNFVGKEVVIAHLEGSNRLYVINIVNRQFNEA